MKYEYRDGIIWDEYNEPVVDCENDDIEHRLAEEMTENVELKAEIAALTQDFKSAVNFISAGVEIMTPALIEQWTGIRPFLASMD